MRLCWSPKPPASADQIWRSALRRWSALLGLPGERGLKSSPKFAAKAAVSQFSADLRLFGLAAALAVGVVFGVIPAWQATGGSLAGVMASESRSSTSTSRRFRSLLVAGEVAAAVVLLCGAGLLLQTLPKLVGGDAGYRAPSESVLTLDFSVSTGKGSRCGGSRRQRAWRTQAGESVGLTAPPSGALLRAGCRSAPPPFA